MHLLPIVRVPRDPDNLVGLELDEFEQAGANRPRAHVARRYVARIDRRPAGSEQRQEGGLCPLQMKGDLVITVGGHFRQAFLPGFAGIDAEALSRLAGQQIPDALDVVSGKGLAVAPFDALLQRQCQFGPFLVPYPVGGKLRDDGISGCSAVRAGRRSQGY